MIGFFRTITLGRRLRGLTVTALLTAVVVGGGTWLRETRVGPGRAAPGVEALLPEDTLIHLVIDGAACAKNGGELDLCRLGEEPEVRAFLKPLLEMLDRQMTRVDENLQEDLGIRLEEMFDLLGGRVSLSLVSLDPAELEGGMAGEPFVPDLLLTVEYQRALDTMRRVLARLERMITEVDLGVLSDETIEGVSVKRFQGAGLPLDFWYVVQDKLFILGTRKQTMAGVIKRLKTGGSGGSLAASLAFKEVAGHVRKKDSTIFAWADMEGIVDVIMPIVEPFIAMQGGSPEQFEAMLAVGYGMDLDGPLVRDRFYVKMDTTSEVWKKVPRKGVPVNAHLLVPASSGLFTSQALSFADQFEAVTQGLDMIPEAADVIDSVVEDVEQLLGADLEREILPLFGPEMAFYMDWHGASLIPDLGLVIGLQDRQTVEKMIDRALRKHAEDVPVTDLEFLGRTLHYVDLKASALGRDLEDIPPLKPTWAFIDDHLLLAPWPEAARRMIREVSGQTGGLRGNPEFTSLMRRIDADRPGDGSLYGVVWIDVKRLAGFLLDNTVPLLQSLIPDEEVPVDLALIPRTEVITRHLHGVVLATYLTGEGVYTDICSPSGALTVPAGMIALGSLLAFGQVEGLEAEVEERGAVEGKRLGEIESEVAVEVATLAMAVRLFHAQEGRLPAQQEWPAFMVQGSEHHPAPYLSKRELDLGVLRDPWGRPYLYERGGDGSFSVYSLGSDGKPGGSGPARDHRLTQNL